jgi:hypothetical protein
MNVTCAIGMGVAVGPLGTSGVAVLPVPASQDGNLIKESWQPVLLKAKRIKSTVKLIRRILSCKGFINPPLESLLHSPA